MSAKEAKEQVNILLSEAGGSTTARVEASLTAAKLEVQKMLNATKNSLHNLCVNMENAKDKAEVKAAFKQFNAVVSIFLEAAPGVQHDNLVRDCLCSFELSPRLKEGAPVHYISSSSFNPV